MPAELAAQTTTPIGRATVRATLAVRRPTTRQASLRAAALAAAEDKAHAVEAAAMEAKLGKELEKWTTVPMADKTMLPGMAELKEIIEQAVAKESLPGGFGSLGKYKI